MVTPQAKLSPEFSAGGIAACTAEECDIPQSRKRAGSAKAEKHKKVNQTVAFPVPVAASSTRFSRSCFSTTVS